MSHYVKVETAATKRRHRQQSLFKEADLDYLLQLQCTDVSLMCHTLALIKILTFKSASHLSQ